VLPHTGLALAGCTALALVLSGCIQPAPLAADPSTSAPIVATPQPLSVPFCPAPPDGALVVAGAPPVLPMLQTLIAAYAHAPHGHRAVVAVSEACAAPAGTPGAPELLAVRDGRRGLQLVGLGILGPEAEAFRDFAEGGLPTPPSPSEPPLRGDEPALPPSGAVGAVVGTVETVVEGTAETVDTTATAVADTLSATSDAVEPVARSAERTVHRATRTVESVTDAVASVVAANEPRDIDVSDDDGEDTREDDEAESPTGKAVELPDIDAVVGGLLG
jgi:hypothetical protein